MRIAFVGKGGSGKTTLASLFIRYLGQQSLPVLAIDADINQHLADASQLTHTQPPVGEHTKHIAHVLSCNNPRIADGTLIKSTPPGRGSQLLKMSQPHDIWNAYASTHNTIKLITTGQFNDHDIGTKCFHSKISAVEMILNHLVDTESEYVIVDMTAGADAFASGLFTKFDLTCMVCEPTLKSVSVFKQYATYAKQYNINIRVVGNKIESDDDMLFLREHVGDALLTHCTRSAFIKQTEKGNATSFDSCEPENLAALHTLHTYVNTKKRDWPTYEKHMKEFHIKNAKSWANTAFQSDLTKQIDPEFSLADSIHDTMSAS